ncbi:cell division protein FtsA [Tepiditoga spiralis]|uniref:Cell division protein FtsA n=1 Tax=Tepiditoga spiralis TaxID=2108365 RepID=A0A7G1G5Q8_9BACT|nr:cell division FtsA domain-containing protein [Tepiditoga spiralis]BBE31930.1 cell division protein FtsA [Tepiditoga spiralis]
MAKNYLIGLDIGSFKTKGILFEEENKHYRVLSYGSKKTSGITGGELKDIEKITETIRSLINDLTKDLSKKSKSIELITGYSTNELYISSENFTVEYTEKTEIVQKELEKIKNSVVKKYSEDKKMILDISFTKFIVDDKIVSNPIAFTAQKSLTVSLNVVWASENSFVTLSSAFKKIVSDNKLPAFDTTLSMAYAATTSQDRENGITFLDFGYRACRAIVFKDGIPSMFHTFPYGIKYVLKDITTVLKTTEAEANRLLIEHAVCLKDTKVTKKIDFNTVSKPDMAHCTQNLLNKIVYARVREIISRFNGELSKKRFGRSNEFGGLQGGVIYCGGGSQIKNIENTIQELMGDNFRKGQLSLEIFKNVPEELNKKMEYLSVFGLIERNENMKINEGNVENTKEINTAKKNKKGFGNAFKSIFKKLVNED